MFMPVYNFTFPGSCAGQAYTVRDDSDNSEVASGTLGSASNGAVVQQETLDEGSYTGRAYDAATGLQADSAGSIDLVDSFGGGVGASETAYFVATAPVAASDANGSSDLLFVADDRHGTLPEWASVDGSGEITLTNAGTWAWSFVGTSSFDFSATTPQDSGGVLTNGFGLTVDEQAVTIPSNPLPGDGTDVQDGPVDSNGGTSAATSITAAAFPFATDVADGVVTPRCALTITRIAQAAVLPA